MVEQIIKLLCLAVMTLIGISIYAFSLTVFFYVARETIKLVVSIFGG
jgi:hypothetical protein